MIRGIVLTAFLVFSLTGLVHGAGETRNLRGLPECDSTDPCSFTICPSGTYCVNLPSNGGCPEAKCKNQGGGGGGGGGTVPCGDNTCPASQGCCNASCGVCGAICTTLYCP
mmetsp:Transcript_5688/g.8976  ORF Transcript_5688/g.8976 Transcript_5688/m.8976 type:complete len:111 (+) Transcript_5688:130-462(+)